MLNTHADLVQVIHDYMSDPETAWQIGSRASFSRAVDDEVDISLDHAGGTIVGAEGAVRINAIANSRLAPMEALTEETWEQAALLCLREFEAGMAGRKILKELGSDMMAARSVDRIAPLFDLGAGAVEADYCVRTHDAKLCEYLRGLEGTDVSDNQELHQRLEDAEADHVAVSRLGRIERYGNPFPKLSESNLLAPEGYAECLRFTPPQQAPGAVFDDATYGAFRVLCGIFDDPFLYRLKESVAEEIQNEAAPDAIMPSNDDERRVVRIAVRQLAFRDGPSETLNRWKAAFDA